MSGWRVQRFNFTTEVLPVVLAGTLLDILGRYCCGYLQSRPGFEIFSFLFLDMIGTAFSAILLGPWWGATVGIFSALINGNFQDNYFPFGVVNACGGLAWGYVAFFIAVREELAEDVVKPRDALRCFVVLILSGALACGIASFAVQAVLYPPMNRPFVYGKWYEATSVLLKDYCPAIASPAWTLFWGAMSREFLDKTLTLSLAFACVTAYYVPKRRFQSLPTQRIRVDVSSILSFVAVYAVYLCFARVFRPTIRFAGGTKPVEWLTYSTIITLLYFPLLLAIVAFLFGILHRGTPYGRRVEAYRYRRRTAFVALLSREPWRVLQLEAGEQVVLAKRMYGLAAAVAAWPITKATGLLTADVGLTYAGIVSGAMVLFFYQNFQLVRTTQSLNEASKSLLDWLGIESKLSDAGRALDHFAKQFGGIRSAKRWNGSLAYLTLASTKMRNATKGDAGGKPDQVLIAITTQPLGMAPEIQTFIENSARGYPSRSIFVLSVNARDPESVSWLAKCQQRKINLNLVDWACAQECLETLGRRDRLSDYLVKLGADMRAVGLGGKLHVEQGAVEYKDLAARTLPNLAHVMDRMSHGQSVLDLGAGRGRHTLYALKSGLGAIAIERKPEAYRDLVAAIDVIGKADMANAVLGDYTKIDVEDLGRADLVISTGVLQHVGSFDELRKHLGIMQAAASRDFGKIYIEMLFDMLFDGKRPDDGRLEISQAEFEKELLALFPSSVWSISRVYGPTRKLQTFEHRPRSFFPPADRIELTTVEYMIIHAS